MQERELLNGRVAMLAVASYVATEFVTRMPVVKATPLLFEPLIFSPWFRSFMDASFGAAGMGAGGCDSYTGFGVLGVKKGYECCDGDCSAAEYSQARPYLLLS